MAAAAPSSDLGMKYRFLGDSGLLVSAFSFGCMTFSAEDQSSVDEAYEILVHAFQHGVNFWDTAEVYSNGISERVTGQVLARGIANGVWTREDIVLSTKIFSGTKDGPNAKGLSRKHLVEGIKASLTRLDTDYVDVIFCHRPEKYTPIEEVVRSMNFIISQGWAFYWGTSEWQEQDILEACEIADRLGLIRPIVEQPQYNLFARSKVEVEYQALYSKYKLGLTIWSPLAFGILTGKYATGIPENARLSVSFWAQMLGDVSDRAAQAEQLRPIAEELQCSLAQLALAWCATNANVSTVLLGAKTLAQLKENLQAWPVVAKITPAIKAKIEAIIPFTYKAPTRDSYYTFRGKRSGLRDSALGFGCTVQGDTDTDSAYVLVTTAYCHGVTYFDTAVAYGAGGSERVVGHVVERGTAHGVWTGEDLVLSMKLVFAPHLAPKAVATVANTWSKA